MENQNPIQEIMLPVIHTGLHPNLLTSPPTMGPDIRYTPHMRLPTSAMTDFSALNESTNGSNITPNV